MIALLVPILFNLGAPAPQAAPMRESVAISIRRTVCFGSCPEYEVRIGSDGAGARRDARDARGHTAADYAREKIEFERWRTEHKLADMDEESPKEFSTILLLLGAG